MNRAICVILLLLGAIGLIVGRNNFVVHSAGIIAILASVALARASIVKDKAQYGLEGNALAPPTATMWIIGVVLAAMTAVAFYALYLDAVRGYKDVGPVYFFAASGLVCGVFWAGLLAKLSGTK